MLRKLVLAVSVALVAAVLSPLAAAQGGRAFRSQTIRAGIIISPSAPNNASAAPFAWYNLDNATGVKPAEWTFVNPNNEGTVSQTTFDRWKLIDPSIAGFQTRVTNGLRTQKRYASYWEVNLVSASDSDLAQYDVLLYAPLGNVQLNPSERSKLNRFVDGGGVLWVDYDQDLATQDEANGLPIPFSTVELGIPFSGVQNDTFHPLFNLPLPIAGNDLDFLAQQYSANKPTAWGIVPVTSLGALEPYLQTVPGGGDYARLRPVSQFYKGGYYPTTMVGRIGDGFEVVTVRQVAEKLNRTVGDASFADNRLFLAQTPKLLPEGLAAAKFAVNLVSLTSSAPQFGGGSRKGFASGTDIGAPLLNRYAAPYTGGGISSAPKALRPPVVYKGLIVVAEDDHVAVYDANPARDADGDGDPDDGLIDLSVGTARDLICQTPALGVEISSVSVAEVIDAASGVPRDQILVTDRNGRVLIYPVYGNVSAGRRSWPSAAGSVVTAEGTIPASGTTVLPGGDGPQLFSPTVYGSFAYVVDAQNTGGLGATATARVRVIDLRTMTELVASDGSGKAFLAGSTFAPTPPPSGPATVGQIPIADNSGGADVVAYVPVQGTTGATTGGPGFVSFWVGAKGEKPFSTELTPAGTGATVQVTTRAGTQSLPIYIPTSPSPLGVRVSLVRSDGSVYSAAQMAAIFDGAPTQSSAGILSLTLKVSAWPADVDQDNPLRIDYTIDWGAANSTATASIERGRMLFADPTSGGRRLIGGIALGAQGTLFATVGTQDTNVSDTDVRSHGTVYALKEEGRGSFRMLWRWDLYPEHVFNYEGGSTTVGPSLPDNDPVQSLPGAGTFLAGPLVNTSIQGAPVVRGDKVFVTVSGKKGIFVPASAVLCFQADPPQPEIRTSLDLSNGFAIVQPDFNRSSNPKNPTTPSILSNGGANETVYFDKASVGTGGTIRFTSLAGVRNGQVVDSISLSEPVVIRRTGQGDTLIDPNTQGDRWSPLLWYTILHGTQLVGPAYAAGNSLYMSGTSYLPSILVDGTFPPRADGFLTGLRTDVDTQNALPTTQAFTTNPTTFTPQSVVLDANRPWLRQLISLDYPRASASFSAGPAAVNSIYSSPYFILPQNPRNTEERGRFTFDDYKIRVSQAAIPLLGGTPYASGETASYGVVGGDKTLVAWNARGTFAYERSDFWIADQGRVAKVDPSGNVLFDSRASLRLGDTGGSGAGNVVPLVRPTRVVPIDGEQDLLVVDTGGNKILRMDPAGTVSREIGGFTIDPNFVPNGYRSNDPLTLKNPRDATTFTTRVLAADNKFSLPAPAEEWVHTLIADEGNHRLVELVDRYVIDATSYERIQRTGEPGTLLWQSPAQVSGKGYDYISISRVRIPNGASIATARYAFVAGLGNTAPGRQDAGEVPPADTDASATIPGAAAPADGRDATGGGIVVFDPQLPAGVAVYSSIEVPAVQNIHRWDDRRDLTTGDTFKDGNVNDDGNGFNADDLRINIGLNDTDDGWSADTGSLPAQEFATNNPHRLSGVSSVTASVVLDGGTPRIAVMVADRTGIYEVMPIPAATTADPNRTVLRTRWMITEEAYRAMNRSGDTTGSPVISADSAGSLRATYARRLDDENVLLVNGYVGKTRGLYSATGTLLTAPTVFNGEILQIDGRIDPSATGTPRGIISTGYNVQSDNLGFGSRSIKVRFGVLEGARGILQPVYADRR